MSAKLLCHGVNNATDNDDTSWNWRICDAGRRLDSGTAEASELHDYIYAHLQTCPAPRPRSADAALHKAAG